MQAAALGIRTPRILGVADAGLDGMVLAYEAIDGVSADRADVIDDDALIAVWSMVHQLHDKRIAHRDLRLANIFLDADQTPWLIDFGFSELAASDQLLGTDVAELLASTAARVGTERAVAAAHQATDLDELEWAMPWLQPLALSTATRQAIGGDEGLAPIRAMLIEQCGVPAEEPVRLQRVSGKTLFVIATIGLSAWFLIPQLADIDNIWEQTRSAAGEWVAIAVAFSLLTYVRRHGELARGDSDPPPIHTGARCSDRVVLRQPHHPRQGRRAGDQHQILPASGCSDRRQRDGCRSQRRRRSDRPRLVDARVLAAGQWERQLRRSWRSRRRA